MEVTVRVVLADPAARPAPGTPVRVELRDVTEQDVAAVLLSAAEVVTTAESGAEPVVTVTLDLPAPEPARDLVLWARVAVSGSERTSTGDLLSTRSVPLPRGDAADASATVDLPVVAI
jgi:hypothetical protein